MPNLNFSDPNWLAQLASVGETWPPTQRGTPAPAVTGGAGGTPPWNLNAPPTTGQGAYGMVPGAIGLPPVYQDVAGVFPGLSGNIAALSKNIGSDLAGELDPETIAMLQNTSAQFGIGAGTPLSPFSGARGLRQLGLTAEGQRKQGAQELLSALPTISNSLTIKPETQLDVANRNTTLGAAPDPRLAALEAQRLFNEYLKSLGGGSRMNFPGGGGGGAPQNLNAPGANLGWPAIPSVSGTQQPAAPYYGGTGINWGQNQASPQNLWGNFSGGFPGPEGGSVATPGGGGFNDWFNDPSIGGGGGMFGMGGGAQGTGNDVANMADWFNWDPNPTLPDFPEWE